MARSPGGIAGSKRGDLDGGRRRIGENRSDARSFRFRRGDGPGNGAASKPATLKRDTSTCESVEWSPAFADGHNELGLALAKMERMDEAVAQLQKASCTGPHFGGVSLQSRLCSGIARGLRRTQWLLFRRPWNLAEGKNWRCLAELANAYNKTGHSAEAIQLQRQALDLAVQGTRRATGEEPARCSRAL